MKRSASKRKTTSEVAIFGRMIAADNGNLEPHLAQYVLTLGFTKVDQKRVNDLAARNQSGRLSNAEAEELANYVRSSHLLALLHSKARKSLKRAS